MTLFLMKHNDFPNWRPEASDMFVVRAESVQDAQMILAGLFRDSSPDSWSDTGCAPDHYDEWYLKRHGWAIHAAAPATTETPLRPDTEEQLGEPVLVCMADVEAKPQTPQSLLRSAANILDSGRECAVESAIWRIQDAMKMLAKHKDD